MRTQSADTSPEVERIQIELIRQASFAKLLGLTCSMSSTVIQASRNTIRHLHPEMDEEELAVLYTELYYGKELAERLKSYLLEQKTNECA